jgi:uncharacterized protein YbjQ (UPF0145 family)
VKSFETLLERGRREVTIQLKEQAASEGYNAICNVRLNTASVGGMSNRAAAMASVIGWATAYDCDVPGAREKSPAPASPDFNHLA